MDFSADDHRFMARALQLAENGRYTTRPNPRVGCVLVKSGKIIAEGWHYRAGGPHAEIHALQQLTVAAESITREDITAYVTLEPCAHQGRTGSCAKTLAVKANGICRVVYGMEDPNPLVAGKGLAILRQAGCVVEGPLLELQAQTLNQGFMVRMQCQRPRVTAKIAISIDGRTAMASGESQWITGAAARRDVQRLRAQSCAVVTGIASVLQDNSRLTIRPESCDLPNIDDIMARPPLRVILDTHLRIADDAYSHAAIFDGINDDSIDRAWREPSVVIFTSEHCSDDRIATLQSRYPTGVVIEKVAATVVATDSSLDLEQVLFILATRYACNDILLETGATLLGAFLQQQRVDELIIYQAPILMGSDARPLADWSMATMSEKQQLTVIDQRMVGNDLRITAVFN